MNPLSRCSPGAPRTTTSRAATPPVYRPGAESSVQGKRVVPPVYQPRPAAMAAPPVYRSSALAQSKIAAGPGKTPGPVSPVPPKHQNIPVSAPVLRPVPASNVQLKPAKPPAAHAVVVQAKLNRFEAMRELQRLLRNSGIELEGEQRRSLEARAELIGAEEATTKENITERLLTDRQIEPVFRRSRLAVDVAPWKSASSPLTDLEGQILEILKEMTFFSGTKTAYLESIRRNGLSVNEGGKVGGGSDTLSVGNKRSVHMTESKKKVFVTRSFKEASGYAEEGTQPVMVFVPKEKQAALAVDPRSQNGLYSEKSLLMVDQEGGAFGGGIIGAIRDELRARGTFAETQQIRQAYMNLLQKGALPQRQENLYGQLAELRRRWEPILDRLTDPTYGPINRVAALVIAELRESDSWQQVELLRRLRPMTNSGGEVVGIAGYLRGG